MPFLLGNRSCLTNHRNSYFFRNGIPHRTKTGMLVACVLSAVAFSASAQTPPAPPASDRLPVRIPESLTLQAAVDIALESNPGLASYRAQADAMEAVPSQAGALPDPRLAFNALNLPTDTFDLDQEAMTQLQVAVSQAVPFPGKRGLRRQAAQYDSNAATVLVDERRVELIGQIRAAWWRLLFLDRALEIVDQNQALMRDFVEIAQTKYKVGGGLQQDVLLAQLELSRLLSRELGLRGMREATQSNLNALLNRPSDSPIVLPQKPASTVLPNLPTEPQLLQMAADDRPLLSVEQQRVDAARSRLDLAKKDFYPDFKLGAGYGFRQGDDPLSGKERSDMLSLTISVNVPLYSKAKQSKTVDQRRGELAARQYTRHDTLRSVQAAVSRNLADYKASRDQAVLFDTAIIPQAQQTVSSMLAGYQVNQVDFLNVVSAQIILYNSQIDYWRALSDAKQALAKLAAAIGSETLYE